jgi:hypothetical protein
LEWLYWLFALQLREALLRVALAPEEAEEAEAVLQLEALAEVLQREALQREAELQLE